MDARRSAAWFDQHRLGVGSACAAVFATMAGVLAAASPAGSPAPPPPAGLAAAADATLSTGPAAWGDDLTHVVVLSTLADRVDAPTAVGSPPDEVPAPTTAGSTLDAGTVSPVASLPSPSDAPTDEQVAEALRQVPGVESVVTVAPGTHAVATAGDVEQLAAVPGVEGVVDDLLLYPTVDDPGQASQWALLNTGSPDQSAGLPGIAGADANVVPAWAVTEGAGTVIAVIDTGVQLDHPDLAGRLWVNTAEVCGNGVDDDANGLVDDCNGWDFGMNDADPGYDVGASGFDHGTHVSGIVAAGRNGVGIVGVAPQAQVMALKASLTSGALPSSAIAGAIAYAVAQGVEVINLSLGTLPGTSRAAAVVMENAVASAVAAGVTVVAAAGNSNVDLAVSPVWPANLSLYYDGVITVGATTNTDSRSSFSNYGSPVNVYAPGSFLYSSVGSGAWGYKSGTSMAAPMVAGAVALARGLDPTATPAALRTSVVGTARPLSWGAGILDAGALVAATPPAPPPSTPQVVYEGANTLQADRAATIGVRLTAATLPAGVTSAKVSIATVDASMVYAVDGLAVAVGTSAGATNRTTAADGSLPAVGLDAATAVSATEWTFTLGATLPAGSYALLTELVDSSGAAVGGSFVGYVQVAAATVPTTSTSAPATTLAGSTTTALATTTVAGPTTTRLATSTVAPPTTVAGPTTTAVAPTTTPPATTTTRPVAPTTTVVGPTTTVVSPTTTVAPTTTRLTTTTAAATTTSAGPTTTRLTTTTVASPTTTLATATTTPTPSSVVVGPFRIDSMNPRSGSMAGGTSIVLTGSFPTTVPVYVWFGPTAVSQATVEANGTRLTLVSPQVLATGVVDITVRFTTTQAYALVYTAAYTYTLPGTPTVTTVVGSTTTTLPSAATTAPVTTVVASTVPAGPTTTTPVRTRGTLRLRPQPASGAISRLTTATWPPVACASASCPASSI